MTLQAVFNYKCDVCDNVPGWHCTFPTQEGARNDAISKGWAIGRLNHWEIGVSRDLCPYCICPRCKGTKAIPDFKQWNEAYGEPTPVKCPECCFD